MLEILEKRKNDLERAYTDARFEAAQLQNLPAEKDLIADNFQRQNELIARISLYYQARGIRSDFPGVVERYLFDVIEKQSGQIRREKILRNMTEKQKINTVLDWITNTAEALEACKALKLVLEGEEKS